MLEILDLARSAPLTDRSGSECRYRRAPQAHLSAVTKPLQKERAVSLALSPYISIFDMPAAGDLLFSCVADRSIKSFMPCL